MTQPNSTPFSAAIRIARIRDIEFVMVHHDVLEQEIADFEKSVKININGRHIIVPESKFVVVRVKVEFFHEGGTLLLRHEMEAAYEIVNFDEVVQLESNESYQINQNVLSTVLSVTISTMRGALMEKTANSRLKNMYLPIVSTKALMENIQEKK